MLNINPINVILNVIIQLFINQMLNINPRKIG